MCDLCDHTGQLPKKPAVGPRIKGWFGSRLVSVDWWDQSWNGVGWGENGREAVERVKIHNWPTNSLKVYRVPKIQYDKDQEKMLLQDQCEVAINWGWWWGWERHRARGIRIWHIGDGDIGIELLHISSEKEKGTLTELVLVAQWCPALCDPTDGSPPGSSAHGNLQARILEWVAIPFSRGSFQPGEWTWVSCIAGRFFTVWATMETLTLTRADAQKLLALELMATYPYYSNTCYCQHEAC